MMPTSSTKQAINRLMQDRAKWRKSWTRRYMIRHGFAEFIYAYERNEIRKIDNLLDQYRNENENA